jgi:hypothetical protein
MSQIAKAFSVSAAEIAQWPARRGKAGFWERALRHEIVPGFGWSGSVIVVLAEFLGARGLLLPLNTTDPILRRLAEDGWVLSSATSAEAEATQACLTTFDATDMELAAFCNEWFGEIPEEYALAMRAGLAWLSEVYRVGSTADWTLVCVG